jgi:glucoamylase
MEEAAIPRCHGRSLPGIAVGTYSSSIATYQTLISAIQNYVDSFITIVTKYTPSSGGLAEQYRSTGSPVSAVDLTWSYAALLTAFDARKGVTPASWGAKNLKPPNVCLRGGGNTGDDGPILVTFNIEHPPHTGVSGWLQTFNPPEVHR